MRAAHSRIVTSRSTSVRASIYSYSSLLTVNSRLYRASIYALHYLSNALLSSKVLVGNTLANPREQLLTIAPSTFNS